MNTFFFLYRLSNKLPRILNKILFYVFYIFFPVKRFYDLDSLKYLNSISPDKGGSSLCECNIIKKNPKYDVQIIVPVYNVEKYLNECLDSIFNQKTQYSFLVVAVNDGSCDNSQEILAEYGNYPNLKIINQENKGLSGARNAGLKEIDAEYVMFVDSDDFLCDGALDGLIQCAKRSGADIVQGNYSYYWDEGVVKKGCFLKNGECSPQSLFGFACGKLYKACLWENFQFPEKYWFEDSINRLLLFNVAKNAFVTDVNVFMYRQNPNGISSSSTGNKKSLDTVWVTKRLIEDYMKLNLPMTEKVCEAFLKQFMYNYSRILPLDSMKINYAVFELYKDIFKSIEKDLSNYSNSIKIAYNSLKNNDFKKFLLCSIFLK